MLAKYSDSNLRKSMNLELAKLNVVEGNIPKACHSYRPTPLNYRAMAQQLVDDLLDQNINGYSKDMRGKWCAPDHFV